MSAPTIELRLGDYRDVLADVARVDAVITDPPYSERTHRGALDATTLEVGVSGYRSWGKADAAALIACMHGICDGWIVAMTDDILHQEFRWCSESHGRYAFPILPVLQQQPRVSGDGPSPSGCFLAVSRPRKKRFLSWGSLPGWYQSSRDGKLVRGGKPLTLMRAIVRDYSRPGDLICDPCAGGATTLIAAHMEGRSAIGAELDLKTYDLAKQRIDAYLAQGTLFTPRTTPTQEVLIK
jgi:site-specific DNA-methyltransferase (adenine-specific)